jgi:DNA mismatch repair protein MutS
MTDETTIDIKDGRHPVVEKALSGSFVPNDTFLDCEENHLIILTGPNMAGKSTYIRQSAILVILAQMGSYIPATSARIGVVDKIFTRIGAHDEIAKGQSTFMVEMSEAADILNNLTDRSLVILDEIGRGTSTYDGLSLAWAIAEHFKSRKARTLFATHFHELTALADEPGGVKNYNVAVKEWKDEIVFLHKIVPGSTDDSYGIYVARLAGIPPEVIKRSQQILIQLELQGNLKEKIFSRSKENQLDLFTTPEEPLLEQIKSILQAMDINSLTPLQALNRLQELREIIDTQEKK